MNEKVKLTKEQAKAIEFIRENIEISKAVKTHAGYPNDWGVTSGGVNGMPLDTLIRALYIGYEVEQTVEEQLVQEYEDLCGELITAMNEPDISHLEGKIEGLKKTLDIIGMKVKGINA